MIAILYYLIGLVVVFTIATKYDLLSYAEKRGYVVHPDQADRFFDIVVVIGATIWPLVLGSVIIDLITGRDGHLR